MTEETARLCGFLTELRPFPVSADGVFPVLGWEDGSDGEGLNTEDGGG
jgi:hypothetical protein